MSALFLYKRRVLPPRRVLGDFQPEGAGLYDFTNYGDEFPRESFDMVLRVWWASISVVADVLLQFVDPTDTSVGNRMVLVQDTNLDSFVEDNLGQWWLVPTQYTAPTQYQQLQFTASGASDSTLNVEIAWVPRWPCSLGDLLERLNARDLMRPG